MFAVLDSSAFPLFSAFIYKSCKQQKLCNNAKGAYNGLENLFVRSDCLAEGLI